MMTAYQYVRPQDVQQYRDFCVHHAQAFGRPLPPELWHYTDANGLIGILRDGQIWTTQVSCLNDTLEQLYFGDLVHEAVKARRRQNADADLEILLRVADDSLANRDLSAAGQFVACFSEVEDDLGQWRGYGGGECGYAIGFRPDGVLQALTHRANTLLLPMGYADTIHSSIVADVIRCAEIFFKSGLGPGRPSAEQWA